MLRSPPRFTSSVKNQSGGQMAKYKDYDYSQDVMIPVSLENQLIPGTLEFAIHTLVESRLDMSVFEERYKNDETGRRAYDPKIILKVVLFGYSRGLLHSRKLERACRENVTFMALSCMQYPDHSTIAAFVSSMKDEILPLFRDVLLVCEEEGLLGGTFFAQDGCKLPSNASKEWSGTISDFQRKKDKIEKKVKALLEKQEEIDKKGDDDEKGSSSSGGSNRKKQIERLQKGADRIEKFLKDNGPKMGKQGREIKSNITDNESATMVTSHGTIQGYNGQALVDSKKQVILYGEAFGDGQDHYHIPPVLDGAKENIQRIGYDEDYFEGKILTADSLYHSSINLKKCEAEKLDAYIPDKDFRKRDPRLKKKRRWGAKEKKRKFKLQDFRHNEITDEYICPQGKALKLQVKKTRVNGVIYRRYVADRNDCQGCDLKSRCIIHKNAKRRYLNIPVGSAPDNLTKPMIKKIDSEEGRKIYSQRIGVVEPVFANVRTHKRMDHFTLRGKIKVNIQWLLYCMIHNIGKIAAYGFT